VPSLRLRSSERFLAWLVTGPLGHLLAGLADCGVLVWRLVWMRIRRSDHW